MNLLRILVLNENCISIARNKSVGRVIVVTFNFIYIFFCCNNIKLMYGTHIETLKCLHTYTTYKIRSRIQN